MLLKEVIAIVIVALLNLNLNFFNKRKLTISKSFNIGNYKVSMFSTVDWLGRKCLKR